MTCDFCGSEEMGVVRTWRNKKYVHGRGLVFSPNYDLRKMECLNCGRVYLVNAELAAVKECRGASGQGVWAAVTKPPYRQDDDRLPFDEGGE